MKLHIFNPEHDLALAANQANYTAPHAGRQLHNDLSFIPALWADEGDLVLVDDIDDACDKVRHLGGYSDSPIYGKVEFITPLQLQELMRTTMSVDSIHPWGWDKALATRLKALGCPEIMLPTAPVLDSIREVSSRQWAAAHLQTDADYVESAEALREAILRRGRAVVKAPWSSSGRGVRYVAAGRGAGRAGHALAGGGTDMEATLKWAANVIRQQGGLTVEPYYNKVRDFGMEFEMRDGRVAYCGLSLFDTVKGAYSGNLLATEEEKEAALLACHVGRGELEAIRQNVARKMEPALGSIYSGPFGIDMMVCSDGRGNTFVNPCVELNLRRTMGHVALALGVSQKASHHIMRVDFDGNRYHLRVRPGGEVRGKLEKLEGS